jgi:hypothetical protein
MSDDERSLYDDVTEYLLQPSLCAFASRQRRLLLIGFHRRMASSARRFAGQFPKTREVRFRRRFEKPLCPPPGRTAWIRSSDESPFSPTKEHS